MILVQVVTERYNPISAAIRFSTRSWASHAEFTDTEAGTTFGARMSGVHTRWSKDDHYSRVERFTADGIEEAYDWALTQIGKPYDFTAILGMTLNRNWREEDSWFCSELVAAAFEHAGHPLLSTNQSVGVYRITPRDLLLSPSLVKKSRIWMPS